MPFYLYICDACEQGGITCIQVREVIDACLIILFNLLYVWKFLLVSFSENWTTVRHTVGTLIFLCQRNPRMGKLVMMGNINKKKNTRDESHTLGLGWENEICLKSASSRVGRLDRWQWFRCCWWQGTRTPNTRVMCGLMDYCGSALQFGHLSRY